MGRSSRLGRRTVVTAQRTIRAIDPEEADGTAERDSAIAMTGQIAAQTPCTVAADKAYDTRGFVAQLRQINATPHVAHNIERSGGSAIDGRPPVTPDTR
jgi:type 1 fimbria pilin